jgi:eight-cysteine-cluster-containing protein
VNLASAVVLYALLGCSGPTSPVAVAVAPELGTPAGGGSLTAEQLYGACEARVEGSSAPGECHTDSDCARAGCSQEVCVPARLVADVQSTCERLPCFTTLDTCGCHEGICTWTLKEPDGSLKTRLPGGPGSVVPATDAAAGSTTEPPADKDAQPAEPPPAPVQ